MQVHLIIVVFLGERVSEIATVVRSELSHLLQNLINMHASNLPSFKDLPAVEGLPHGCAWGLWDKDGVRDNVGSLNLLTPEVVQKAREEIKSGVTVSLK